MEDRILYTNDPIFKGKKMYYKGDGAWNSDRTEAEKYTESDADKMQSALITVFKFDVQIEVI